MRVVAVLAPWLLACGGSGAQVAHSAPALEEPQVEMAADALPPGPGPCAGIPTAAEMPQVEVLYSIQGELDSQLAWRAPAFSTEDAANPVATATFELRERSGYEAGTETWVCTHGGLALQQVVSSRSEIRFEPPLLVLPRDDGDGLQVGQAWLGVPEAAEPLSVRYAFERQAQAPSGPIASHFDAGARVRSVLILIDGGQGPVLEVETESSWGLSGQGLGVVLHRQQRMQASGQPAVEREETAESLTLR